MAVYLLIANETAESPELHAAAVDIQWRDPDAEFVIVIPATPLNVLQQFEGNAKTARGLAGQRAHNARRALESSGIRVRSARTGDGDPYIAVEEALRTEACDAILLATFPLGVSQWLRMDLPSRIARRHPNVQLIHVVASSHI